MSPQNSYPESEDPGIKHRERLNARRAFGKDPVTYDKTRPPYPPRVYQILRNRCGLKYGSRVFEIGPGSGRATRQLLRLGANPLTLVEPDERLANYLSQQLR